jgi:hypothetical protein
MRKIALFTFNGDPTCFVHVLLNALDMKEKGYDARVVMEGAATRLIKQFHDDPSLPFANLYKRVVADGLVDAVCEACAGKMGARESAVEQGLRLVKEMSGHPSIAGYLSDGYEVMTF